MDERRLEEFRKKLRAGSVVARVVGGQAVLDEDSGSTPAATAFSAAGAASLGGEPQGVRVKPHGWGMEAPHESESGSSPVWIWTSCAADSGLAARAPVRGSKGRGATIGVGKSLRAGKRCRKLWACTSASTAANQVPTTSNRARRRVQMRNVVHAFIISLFVFPPFLLYIAEARNRPRERMGRMLVFLRVCFEVLHPI